MQSGETTVKETRGLKNRYVNRFGQWVACDARMPEPGKRVCVRNQDGSIEVDSYEPGLGWGTELEGFRQDEDAPTHWWYWIPPEITKSKLVYLASPYTHADEQVVEQRFVAVCENAARLMVDGVHVFSPIAHCHPIAKTSSIPGDFTWWQEYDKHFIDVCDELWVLMLSGWDTSDGVTKEVEYAESIGKRVLYVVPVGSNVVKLPEQPPSRSSEEHHGNGWIGDFDRDSFKTLLSTRLWGQFDAEEKAEEIVRLVEKIGEPVPVQTLMRAIQDAGWNPGTEKPWEYVTRLARAYREDMDSVLEARDKAQAQVKVLEAQVKVLEAQLEEAKREILAASMRRSKFARTCAEVAKLRVPEVAPDAAYEDYVVAAIGKLAKQAHGAMGQLRDQYASVVRERETVRRAEIELKRLREERDDIGTHLEIEQQEHEETKGYRQHAESQLEEARAMLSRIETLLCEELEEWSPDEGIDLHDAVARAIKSREQERDQARGQVDRPSAEAAAPPTVFCLDALGGQAFRSSGGSWARGGLGVRYVRGDIVHAADRDNQRFMERIEAAIGGALGATLVEKAETIAKHVRDLEDKNDRMMAHMDRVADMLDGPDDDMLPTERILEEGAKRALHRITELETEIAELEARVAKVELQRDAAAESRRAIIEGWHADLLRITQACGLVYEVQGDARPIGMVEDIVSAIEQVKQQSRIDEQIESFRSLLRQAVEERQEMVTLLTRATGWDQVGGDGSPVDEQGECDEEA